MTEKTLGEIMSRPIDAYSEENAHRKASMHAIGKRQLRRLSAALGLASTDRDIRSNMGGIAVSGEVTLHTDTLYVQISQSCLGQGHEILFRRCSGRDDYCGQTNHFAPAHRLDDARDFAKGLRRAGMNV